MDVNETYRAEQQNYTALVTIIIPCYNYGKYLADCVNSVIGQSVSNWQCIIVDDGSKDNTREIGSAYAKKDQRIIYIHQANGGLSNARNTGIKNATGKYIQFLDADDIIEPNKLQQQIQLLEREPKLNITYCDVKYFTNDNPSELHDNRMGIEGSWMPYISGSGHDLKLAFINGNIMELGCLLFRHSDVSTLGLFKEDCSGVADWEFCCRAAFKNFSFKFTNIPNGNLLMRHHVSMSSNPIVMHNASLKARAHMANYAGKEFGKTNNDRINYMLEILGYEYLKKGEMFKGRLSIMKAGIRRRNLNTFLRGILPDKRMYQ